MVIWLAVGVLIILSQLPAVLLFAAYSWQRLRGRGAVKPALRADLVELEKEIEESESRLLHREDPS
jgi:hypothetical protein